MESRWERKIREVRERNEGKQPERVTSIIAESAFDELDAAKELLEELSAPAIKLKCLEIAAGVFKDTYDFTTPSTLEIAKQYYEWVTTTK